MAKDKDPILEEKFFDYLFPRIYPDDYKNDVIRLFCRDKLMIRDRNLSSGRLLESYISYAKGVERHDTMGKDFIDNSDAKAASVRWHGGSYSCPISDVHNKIGLLRCLVYERIQDKWYFFLIPHDAYKHIGPGSNIEIPFDNNGNPRRDYPARNVNWWTFEVDTIEGILGDTPAEFVNLKEERIKAKQAKEARKAAKLEARRLKEEAKEEKRLLRQSKIAALTQCSSLVTKTDSTP